MLRSFPNGTHSLHVTFMYTILRQAYNFKQNNKINVTKQLQNMNTTTLTGKPTYLCCLAPILCSCNRSWICEEQKKGVASKLS